MQLHPEAVTAFRFIPPCSPIRAKEVPAEAARLPLPAQAGSPRQVIIMAWATSGGSSVTPHAFRAIGVSCTRKRALPS